MHLKIPAEQKNRQGFCSSKDFFEKNKRPFFHRKNFLNFFEIFFEKVLTKLLCYDIIIKSPKQAAAIQLNTLVWLNGRAADL